MKRPGHIDPPAFGQARAGRRAGGSGPLDEAAAVGLGR